MKNKILPVITLCSIVYGCTTTVNLTLKTNDKIGHTALVSLKDKNKMTKKELGSGLVTKEKNDTLSFKVKNKEYFQVKSTLESGDAVVYSSADISVLDKDNPYNYEIELKAMGKILDDSQSLSTLSSSMKKVGRDIGTTPKDLRDAVENIIGSLVVVLVDEKNKLKEIIYIVHPNILGVRKVKLEDINWPDTREADKIDISGNSAISASADIPMIAKFGATFEKNKVYNLRWEMKGFGSQTKLEDADKSPAKMIMFLDVNEKDQILGLLKKHKNAKVFYINQFYLLKNAELYIKEGKKVQNKEDISSSVITASGVFDFEKSVEKNKSYASQVLNYWGNEYTFGYVNEKIETGGRQNVEYIELFDSKELDNKIDFSTDMFKE